MWRKAFSDSSDIHVGVRRRGRDVGGGIKEWTRGTSRGTTVRTFRVKSQQEEDYDYWARSSGLKKKKNRTRRP